MYCSLTRRKTYELPRSVNISVTRVSLEIFFRRLCEMIGGKCFEAVDKYLKGEISKEELIRVLKEEAWAKNITDEDIDRIVKKALIEAGF